MRLLITQTALGNRRIRVADLFDAPDLIEKTGIEHVYEAEESTTSLAVKACRKIPNLQARPIKLCLMVTQTPDDFLPANAIDLANQVGLPSNIIAFDLNQGCSGFVQALCLVERLLDYYSETLLVTADRYRSKLDQADRSTNSVFSDAATATVCTTDNRLGIIYEDHYTDGAKRNLLFQSASKEDNNGHLHMSGAEIWMFTRLQVVPQIQKAIQYCEENDLKIGGVYLHQASRIVVHGIKKFLPVDKSIVFENYHIHGNTVSSTIPFLLKEHPLDESGGTTVSILAGFGVGLTSSVIVYGEK